MRRGLVVLFALLAVALHALPASAYWTATGAGVAAGTTGSLAAPTGVNVLANSLPNVAVSWTASTGSPTPDGYYVTRSSGGAPIAACASSPTTLLTGTSCTDLVVPDGAYTYTVNAVFHSWTAASAPSGSVSVWTPTKVAFTAQPTTTVAGTAMTPAVAVTVQTAAGTAVPLAGRSVTVTIATNPGGGTLSGTTTASTDAFGVATFAGLSINKSGVGYMLGATSSGLTSDTSGTFTISPASADRFVITSTAVSGTASTSATLGPITVQRQDHLGNPATPAGAVTVNLSSSSTGASFSATSGGATTTSVVIPALASSATFFYGDTKSGAPAVTVSGALASATQNQTINAGTATKFAITSALITAGAASTSALLPMTVERQDTLGNPAPSADAATVTLASTSTGTKFFAATSGATTPTTVTIPANASSVNSFYADTKPGTWAITASGPLFSGSQDVTIVAAAASKLLITSTTVSGVASATATLGAITVERRDEFNHLVTAGSTTVNLSSSSTGAGFSATSGGTLTTSVVIASPASAATFFYGDTQAAFPLITVGAIGLTGATQTATITAAAASKFTITSPARTGIASGTGSGNTGPIIGPITVQRQDQFGNPVNAPIGGTVVTLASNSAGPKVFSATSGGSTTNSVTIPTGSPSVNFFYGDQLAGTPTITVSGGTLASDTQIETITAAAANKLAFGVQPTDTELGDIITPAVTARILDKFGNLSTTSTLEVTIAIDHNGGAILGLLGGSLYGDKTVNAVLGVATFSDLEIRGADGPNYTLKVTGIGSAVESAPFDIT